MMCKCYFNQILQFQNMQQNIFFLEIVILVQQMFS